MKEDDEDLKQSTSSHFNLDPNRDIFIIARDITLNDFGGDIEFRANLQNAIAIELLTKSQTNFPAIIPVMNIVVGCDSEAISPSVLRSHACFTNSFLLGNGVVGCDSEATSPSVLRSHACFTNSFLLGNGRHSQNDPWIDVNKFPERVAIAHIRQVWKGHMNSQTRWANRCKELSKGIQWDRNDPDYSNVITTALCENRIDLVTHLQEIETSFMTNYFILWGDMVSLKIKSVEDGGLLKPLIKQLNDPHTNEDKNHIKHILRKQARRPVQFDKRMCRS
ncbi:uncharacterized protein LOC127846059 [Dreissena polymorpha]|nr:uncharacterized protein LOC127846059 [Dreissena polymorpha]